MEEAQLGSDFILVERACPFLEEGVLVSALPFDASYIDSSLKVPFRKVHHNILGVRSAMAIFKSTITLDDATSWKLCLFSSTMSNPSMDLKECSLTYLTTSYLA